MSAFARRAVLVALAILALLSISAVHAQRVFEATVKTGRWHGVKWKLAAGAWADGSYCVAMTIARGEQARSCGSIRRDRISYFAAYGNPAPAYVVGPVVARARSVQIRFFDRQPVRISTIAPAPTIDPGMRFFVVILPCPATPRSFVARGAAGRVVARLVVSDRMALPVRC